MYVNAQTTPLIRTRILGSNLEIYTSVIMLDSDLILQTNVQQTIRGYPECMHWRAADHPQEAIRLLKHLGKYAFM